MKPFFKLVPLLMSGLLSSCAPLPETQSDPQVDDGQVLIKRIQAWLPGAYSNFAQVDEDGTNGPVTDINIRQLNTGGEPVFLFESQQRNSDTSSHDIYWLKLNRQTRRAEFHFAHLGEDELSLPVQEVLAIAWQRVKPACVIEMSSSDDQLKGQTRPETCLFEHLLQGETRLYRALSLGAETLDIENTLTVSSGQVSAQSAHLKLQKHRVFEGWASIRTETDPGQNKPGEWQLSNVFSLRDDGRIKKLYDQDMSSLGFGLKLAKLPWREGQPPYMLLSVIKTDTEAVQAYTWFEPGKERLDLNLDWFQTSLELKKPNKAKP